MEMQVQPSKGAPKTNTAWPRKGTPNVTPPSLGDTGVTFGPGRQLTMRDIKALEWINEMWGVRMDLLAVLLGHLSGTDRLTERRARDVSSRWVAAGWARHERGLYGEPSWIMLTRAGTSQLGLRRPASIRPAELAHCHAVAACRLAVAAEYPHRIWTPERMVPIEKHRPDAVVTLQDGRRFAVEVELSKKGPHRTAEIVDVHLRRFAGVIYYATEEVARQFDQPDRMNDGRKSPSVRERLNHPRNLDVIPIEPILQEIEEGRRR